jgi:RNA polymerase sigma-70 factor (ECF subfamily)
MAAPTQDTATQLETSAADVDLLARLRAGDSAAFAQIVDSWSPVMLAVARRYVTDRHSAEDVVQDAWLGVLKGLPDFEGRSTLRSWTFAILINRAKTRAVRDARVVATSAFDDSGAAAPTVDPARFRAAHDPYPGHWTSTGAPRRWDEPEGRALGGELGRLLDQALDRLPERQRLVVQMRDVQGMTAEEACAALRLSPQNQRVLLHRGRAALRTALEGYYHS